MTATSVRPTRHRARDVRVPARPYARGVGGRRDRERRRLLRLAGSMLAGAATLVGALAVGLVGGSGTYALWSASTPLPGASFGTGTPQLQLSPTALSATNMLPGETITVSLRITNTGSVPLDVVPSATATDPALAGHFALRARITDQAPSGSCPDLGQDPVLGTTPPTPVTLEPGAANARLVCVAVTALSSLQPGDELPYRIDFDGTSGS